MDLRNVTHRADGEDLDCSLAVPDGAPAGSVVILHGAGSGSMERNIPLAREFAAAGHRTVAVGFSGHGRSSGTQAELSLERRFHQALSALTAYVPEGPLTLVGFSMSGQTVMDLAAHLGDRVRTVCLCAPAVYAPEAWKLPFGEALETGGDSAFTQVIRQPGSWRTSHALDVQRAYTGRAVLIVPEHDEVIPPEITEEIEAALRTRSRFAKLVVEGARHRLGAWMSEHPEDRARLLALCLADDGS